MYDIPGRNSNFHDVGEFHHKFGLHSVSHDGVGPTSLPNDAIKFRVKFLLEELVELMKAVDAYFIPEYDEEGGLIGMNIEVRDSPIDDAEAFDALLDLVYVAQGTAHLMGYPWQEGWDRVQRANMSKVRAQADGSDSRRGSSLDVVKPEGWRPPDIGGLLRLHGWPGQCPARHPQTGRPCLEEGPHDTHRAMGITRMQIFGDNLQESTKENR